LTQLEAFRLLSVANARAFPGDDEDYRIPTGSSQSSASFLAAVDKLKKLEIEQNDLLERNKYDQMIPIISEMLHTVAECSGILKKERVDLSLDTDTFIQNLTTQTFAAHNNRRKHVVLAGVEAIFLQLTTRGLAAPYNTIPRRTLLDALHALTALSNRSENNNNHNSDIDSPRILDYSFRILQRLVTGVGVRQRKLTRLSEKDFSQVLKAFCNAGQMEMAHRIVALQERTPHAPAVSPVAYSILLKGYGRLRELNHVERVLRQAERNRICADTIMLNTLIDAYINCNVLEKAEAVFDRMIQASKEDDNDSSNSNEDSRPNRRTYNTLLKGYAQQGDLSRAQALASEMKDLKLWDSVTTNTLVHAAIVSNNFAAAHEILEKHQLRAQKFENKQWHPNVEAYTELLDGYAKAGKLDRALAVLKTMQGNGVQPNEVTYMCLMGGLGRSLKLHHARRIFEYMKSNGVRPTVQTYNALISALVGDSVYVPRGERTASTSLDGRVDQAMSVLRDMMAQARVRPDAITAMVLVDALGRCKQPRITEATLLVDRLERKGCFLPGNARVYTALVRAVARTGDMERALEYFRKIKQPDTVAVNAFLDTCNRCDRSHLVMETFNFYFRGAKALRPDVITYSSAIQALLYQSTSDSLKQARRLYTEMKSRAKVRPDNALVDIILKAMIRIATAQYINGADVSFIAVVLQDAETLDWEEGQLERRKRAVRAILADRLRENWRSEDAVDLLSQAAAAAADDKEDDELFQRKGWNKVDSGFRLWGGGTDADQDVGSDDQFLKSHGWNDVDSGFRLF